MTTQQRVAQLAGISQAHVNHLISGRRQASWRVAKKLAAIFDTPPELWIEGAPEARRAAYMAKKLAGRNRQH